MSKDKLKTPDMLRLEIEWGRSIEQILKEAYEEHGTQAKVAEALGYDQSTISSWMKLLGGEVKRTVVFPACE